MPHLYQTKFYGLNLCFWDEAYASLFLRNLNFSFSLWLEVRHMPHPCETKLNVEFVLFILRIFLSEKIEFCFDCVKCNTPKYQVFLQSTPISK